MEMGLKVIVWPILGHYFFYYILVLQALRHLTSTMWYSNRVVGCNTLGNTVKQLCKLAGIQGRKINHSLRCTAATRLFHQGIDEQLIMDITGHQSTDGVRAYKRISTDQYREVSSILQGQEKKEQKESTEDSKRKQSLNVE